MDEVLAEGPTPDRRLQVSVRELVAFTGRSGDLVFEFGAAVRPAEGMRAHRRVQQSRPAGYLAEVPVAGEVHVDGRVLSVGGRIDGLQETAGDLVVEEIKTTTAALDGLTADQQPLHWAQLKCYGALLAQERGLEAIGLRLTYVQLASGEQLSFERRARRDELAAFLRQAASRYLERAAALESWARRRDAAIEKLAFPFAAYRPGQREMAVAVYRSLRDGGQLLLQAPTGIGKTMAALFPAIKALPQAAGGKIFYLTARTTGRLAAEKALGELRAKGLALKSLSLTAKDKICFCPQSACTPEECEFARGHYDRVDDAVAALFALDAADRRAVEAVAREHRVCPFELSLEVSQLADCIICDYNYAFDPRVALRRFFEEPRTRHVLLIDEAHNLVDRGRLMFSAEIGKQRVLAVRRQLKGRLPGIHRQLGRINRWLLAQRRRCEAEGGEVSDPRPPEDLYPLLRGFQYQAERWLARNLKADFRQDLLELFFEVSAFLRIAELYGPAHATCCVAEGRELRLKLFCIDPSAYLSDTLNRCRAAVFFSATLSPAAYFRHLLGCAADAAGISLPSPFPPRNLQVYVADGLSTLYRRREQTKHAVAEMLRAFVDRAPGNYLLFFPSYRYLEMVHDQFARRAAGVDILCQAPEMSESEREAFLARFAEDNPGTLAGFAVLGGIFGEGIDLVGRRLTGAAVVGVGLPGVCLERELIRGHFGDRGFDYAYVFPGINRVLQAAGRVIRSEHDRGALLLVDARYGSPRYRDMLPAWWRVTRLRPGGRLPAAGSRAAASGGRQTV